MVLLAIAFGLVGVAPAGACSVDYAGINVGETAWEDNLSGEDVPLSDVVGVFRREVTATVDAGGGWKRGDLLEWRGRTSGSVLSVVETWGEVPSDLPALTAGNDVNNDEDCPGPANGPPLGRSTYYAILEGSPDARPLFVATQIDIDAELRALLGESTPVAIDTEAQAALVSSIRQTRSPWSGVAAGSAVVLAVLAGSYAMIRIRRRGRSTSVAS